MMKNNYEYSKKLLHVCLQNSIPFIYASSASVYGLNEQSAEEKINENPLNPYAYSKFLFDEYVRRILPSAKSQVVGLRYFNVYGPGESHKGRMSSVLYHFNQQLIDTGVVKLFAGTNGFDDGEQRRDFIYVDDVVAMNLWFWQHPSKNGIVNAGTGKAHSFNQAAQAVIDWHGKGRIEYIPFPKDLVGRYQFFTEANTTILREYFGYDGSFHDIFTGTKAYLDTLNAKG